MIEVYSCPGCQRAFRLDLDGSHMPPGIQCPRCETDLRRSAGSLLSTLAGSIYRVVMEESGKARCVLVQGKEVLATSPGTMLPRRGAALAEPSVVSPSPGTPAAPAGGLEDLVSANLERIVADAVSQAADPASIAKPGARLGKFFIQKELGRGAMGVVLKALQEDLGRTVALKLLHCGEMTDMAVKRFLREAQTAGKLSHPNIVGVYEVGEERGVHYIAMEFVEGRTLEDWLQEAKDGPKGAPPSAGTRAPAGTASPTIPGTPSKLVTAGIQPVGSSTTTVVGSLRDEKTRRFLEIMVQVCRGVQYAHEQGVIHRDIKPQNILIEAQGTPKLADFGLAKEVDRGSALTVTGMILGTPSFMAPEQATGRTSDIDAQSDVYSLGAVLYQGIAGRPPHSATTLYELLGKVSKEHVASTQAWNSKVDRDLDAIVLTALARDKSRRYASAGALAEDLRRFLGGEPILAKPPSAWTRFVMRTRKSRKAQVAIAIGLTLVVTGSFELASYLRYESKLSRQVDLAARQKQADEILDSLGTGATDFQVARLDEAVAAAPDYARPRVQRARVRLARGEVGLAQQDIDLALRADPGSAVARYWHGRILDRSGAEPSAVCAEYEAAESSSHGNFLASLAKGWLLLREARSGDFQAAILAAQGALDAAQKAVERGAESEEAFLLRGSARLALGEIHRRRGSQEVARLAEEERQARDEYREAKRDFGLARDANPESPEPYNHRAIAELKLFEFDKAESDLKFALSSAPRMEDGWLNHAVLCFHAGRFEQSMRTLEFLQSHAAGREAKETAGRLKSEVGRLSGLGLDRLRAESEDTRLAAAAHFCVGRQLDAASQLLEEVLQEDSGAAGVATWAADVFTALAERAAGTPKAASYSQKADRYRVSAAASEGEGGLRLLDIAKWAKDPSLPTDLDPSSIESAWKSTR